MSAFLSPNKRLPKLLKNHYYLHNKVLVRVLSVNVKENRVVLFRYDSFDKQAIEYDTAPHYVTPLFRIGEVAKMLNRSVETIRKYENTGLIPKARKYKVSQTGNDRTDIRLYTEKEILELANFFANRNPVGRPGSLIRDRVSKINQKELAKYLDSRFQKVKKNGN